MPQSSFEDIDFTVVTYQGTSSHRTITLRAGETITSSTTVTVDAAATHTELYVIPSPASLQTSGLFIDWEKIRTIRLFREGIVTLPRVRTAMPSFTLLKDGDYVPGSDAGDESVTYNVLPHFVIPARLENNDDYRLVATLDFLDGPVPGVTVKNDTSIVLDPDDMGVGEHRFGVFAHTRNEVTGDTLGRAGSVVNVLVYESDPTKFDIHVVDVTGNLATDEKLREAVENAANRWESILEDVQDAWVSDPSSGTACSGQSVAAVTGVHVYGIDDLMLWVQADERDGRGGILASAGICQVRDSSNAVPGGATLESRQNGLTMPMVGIFAMDQVDVAAMEQSTLNSVVLHEIGHTLGLGIDTSLGVTGFRPWPGSWNALGSCAADPTICWDPELEHPYVDGDSAKAAFDAANGIYYTAGPKVPIEPGERKRRGASRSHWAEGVMDHELMTPFYDPDSRLSQITINVLKDMGYKLRPTAVADDYCLPEESVPVPQGQMPPCVPTSGDAMADERRAPYIDEQLKRGLVIDLSRDTDPEILLGWLNRLRPRDPEN
ncbi:hypothetical protein [Candidatus Palauibacter sp.]|uniref:hypothetical protein n=1 Tax=Candidatus Palauibacter sp. TaxID=3101350 RepID=UPI003AF1F4E6